MGVKPDNPSQALQTNSICIRNRILEVVRWRAATVEGITAGVLWDARRTGNYAGLTAVVVPQEEQVSAVYPGNPGCLEYVLPVHAAIVLYPAETGTTTTSEDVSDWAARLQRKLLLGIADRWKETTGTGNQQELAVESKLVNVEKPDDLGGVTLATVGLEITYRTDGDTPYQYGTIITLYIKTGA